jgi:Tfp pilus assembly protein PilN
VVLAGWVGWQYWSARQEEHLASLQADLQDLQLQVDALQPEAQRYTYLQQEWKSTDWLPPFTQLADSAPTQLCEFERLAMDTDPQGGTRVRVEGRAKQPEPILKWNQTLLEHRQGFDLVPHAIEQGTDQSSFPHRFIIELELPQPGPAEDQT